MQKLIITMVVLGHNYLCSASLPIPDSSINNQTTAVIHSDSTNNTQNKFDIIKSETE